MTPRRRLLLVPGIAGSILVVICLTLLLVPDRQLLNVASRFAEQNGCSFRADRFGKAFPLGVKGAGLVIAGDRGDLLEAATASLHIRLIPLLTGRVVFSFKTTMGGGTVQGEYAPHNGDLRLEAEGVRLEEIPFFRNVADARVKGNFRMSGRFRLKGKEPDGELRLEVKGADITEAKIGELPMPVVENAAIQGMIRRKGASLVLDSFTLQVEGLYVRLKGGLALVVPPTASPLDMTLEVMPKPEFLDKQKLVFLLLTKYLVSPGNYAIPIKGTLAKPAPQ